MKTFALKRAWTDAFVVSATDDDARARSRSPARALPPVCKLAGDQLHESRNSSGCDRGLLDAMLDRAEEKPTRLGTVRSAKA